MKRAAWWAGIFLLACASHGDLLFDMRNDADLYGALDDQASATVTNSGLVATFTASGGEMNRTTSGFGINDAIAGDDTDALDIGEYIDIFFDAPVHFNSVSVSSWNAGSDEGQVHYDGVAFYTVTATGFHDLGGEWIRAGQAVRIESTAGLFGNGWSFDGFSVEVVPEPGMVGLLLLGIGALLARGRTAL